MLSGGGRDGNRVAYLSGDGKELSVLSGNYFSLQNEGNTLFALSHTAQVIIDPRTDTAMTRPIETKMLADRVMFLGSSYSVKDPSEIVERRPLDISRGWLPLRLTEFQRGETTPRSVK